jgi:hypothetical protein
MNRTVAARRRSEWLAALGAAGFGMLLVACAYLALALIYTLGG